MQYKGENKETRDQRDPPLIGVWLMDAQVICEDIVGIPTTNSCLVALMHGIKCSYQLWSTPAREPGEL